MKITEAMKCETCDCVRVRVSYQSIDGPPSCSSCGSALKSHRLNRYNDSTLTDVLKSQTPPAAIGLAEVEYAPGRKMPQDEYKARIAAKQASLPPGYEIHTLPADAAAVSREADETRHAEFTRQKSLGVDEHAKNESKEIHDAHVGAAASNALKQNSDPAPAAKAAGKAAPSPAAIVAG